MLVQGAVREELIVNVVERLSARSVLEVHQEEEGQTELDELVGKTALWAHPRRKQMGHATGVRMTANGTKMRSSKQVHICTRAAPFAAMALLRVAMDVRKSEGGTHLCCNNLCQICKWADPDAL